MSGPRILALSGGVGGAKLARGLSHCIAPDDLAVIVNTGDDFEHLGLYISPDIDSVVYQLAGVNDAARGWGRADETWHFMAALGALGEPDWFRLGDRDLAMHIARTQHLAAGRSLSETTAILARRLGILTCIAPMSDGRIRTKITTTEGELDFQRYFVERQCVPAVRSFHYSGAERSWPSEALTNALHSSRLEAVILCPSNPFISIDPILAVPGVREALSSLPAPIIAVSPIVGGAALKGPLGKMLAELGREVSPVSIAKHYSDLLDGIVLDEGDRRHGPAIAKLGCAVRFAPAIMTGGETQVALARETLELAASFCPAMASNG